MLEFSDVNKLYAEFISQIADKRTEIVIPIIRDVFRHHYAPHLFTDKTNFRRCNDDDIKIFIKDSIFTINNDEVAWNPMLIVKRYVFDRTGDHRYVETISFREFILIYCNPEGQLLLEKIHFEINEIDWDQIFKDEWDEHNNPDYEIPF